MTDEHQDVTAEGEADRPDDDAGRELPSTPTPEYGAPWLPITPQPERS